MSFPESKYNSISEFSKAYMKKYVSIVQNIDFLSLEKISKLIEKTYLNNKVLFVCGNGGSAAIANHMVCDHGKLIGTDTKVRVKIHSLCNSIELVTAISNDIAYDEIFSLQLKNLGELDDTLFILSASGNSRNIINGIKIAKKLGLNVISFTGFDGGEAKKLSDINLNVPIDNYGIIEDAFQSLMQIIAQYIRMKYMDERTIKERFF